MYRGWVGAGREGELILNGFAGRFGAILFKTDNRLVYGLGLGFRV